MRLSDVADVEVIDNSADSYTRLNGEKASILKIYKNADFQCRRGLRQLPDRI
ncbi:MAG: hypothetical protein ACLVJH_19110 [Faecalibacterium prausnitzii]